MDNRLTKKRLSDLLSYDWIFMIVVCIVSIIGWELFYDFGAVKLTAGQNFKYYFDYTISPSGNNELRLELAEKETFSYDVLKLSSEAINQDYNVLKDRLSIREGDIIFTDAVGIKDYNDALAKGETPEKRVRAYSLIDTVDYKVASIDVMIENAKKYLQDKVFIDGVDIQTAFDSYDRAKIDDDKVRELFLNRNGKDNRFRSQSAKNQGILLEIERIEKLYQNVVFMQAFIDNPANSDAIIRYTRFSQVHEFTKGTASKYQDWIEQEINAGRENDVYGINLGKIKGGKNITNFMQYKLGEELNDIIILAFEFTSYQPHLQYESLSFICTMIKACMGV